MIDIERTIYVGCPCGCGQIGVAVSLKKILEKESFFCEACGEEISGPDYPGFLSETVSAPGSKADAQLLSQARDLYVFFYGDPSKFKGTVLEKLLVDHPEYLSLFPISVLPGKVILAMLEQDEAFAAEFLEKHAKNCCWAKFTPSAWVKLLPKVSELAGNGEKGKAATAEFLQTYSPVCPWGKITPKQWVQLLPQFPELADKCGKWKEFTPEQWMQLKSRQYSIYRENFTQNKLGLETFLKCVAKEPGLLEKTLGELGSALTEAKTTLSDAAETVVDAAKNLWGEIW